MTRDPQWDGKLYRPAAFGEGLQPGTVEWVRRRRHLARVARERRERDAELQWMAQETAPSSGTTFWDRLRQLFR